MSVAAAEVTVRAYQRDVTVAVPGPQGPVGPALNFLGAVAAQSALPASAEIGDGWVSEADQHLWVYGSNGWVDLGAVAPANNTYTHVQSLPSSAWVVNHNMGRHPAIHVEDSVSNVVFGSIRHVSDNQAVVTFATVVTGTAVCS